MIVCFVVLQPIQQEREAERENLRRENQHLRELLNAMHARDNQPHRVAIESQVGSRSHRN